MKLLLAICCFLASAYIALLVVKEIGLPSIFFRAEGTSRGIVMTTRLAVIALLTFAGVKLL